jgi:hypothetical protein
MNMPTLLALVVFLLAALAGEGFAGPAPAGYIVTVDLMGEDAAAGTAVVRQGSELAPKLMMPLYSGDVVFVRDPGSRIGFELGGGERVAVGGNLLRFNVEGEIETGDDAWSLIVAVGALLAGDGEEVPENMASKGNGDELRLPLAVRGTNFVTRRDGRLWLAWQGGTGPFAVTVKTTGTTAVFDAGAREIELPLPKSGEGRFSVVIRDAKQQQASARFRLREASPQAPEGLLRAAPGPAARAVLAAAWLADHDGGAWSVEAAQELRASREEAAAALLARLVAGRRAGP